MAQWHRIQPGETVAKIAWRLGLPEEKIWNHPENSTLRVRRANPNVLNPGDRLFIPDLERREEPAATDQRHRFVLNQPRKQLIRVRWVDRNYQPIRQKRYFLMAGTEHVSGLLSDDGLVECWIPMDCEEVRVTLWLRGDPNGPGKTYRLKVGHLNPLDEMSGRKARLANLGVYYGAVDNEEDSAVAAAEQYLQRKTAGTLEAIHGV